MKQRRARKQGRNLGKELPTFHYETYLCQGALRRLCLGVKRRWPLYEASTWFSRPSDLEVTLEI